MSINEFTADRIRRALSSEPDVYEKRMFGGLAFMVNGKMCVCVGGGADEDMIMVRVGPHAYADALERTGASPTIMKGRPIRGYVDVDETGQRDLGAWIRLALDFNRELVGGQ
ncbi:MAG: TfoX/Sxy family protein [Lautropia sp.]|nr:TfoX/Sxy family protein [Lautropia sp.]